MTIEQIKEIFKERYGDEFRCFRAPGRINLIGEHTDYNMGFVTPAAINRYINLVINPNNEDIYRIYAKDFKNEIVINKDDDIRKLPSWVKYPMGVVNEIKQLGFDVPGFDAVYGGDIPSGAGLSSSAAIEMAFAVAFNHIYKFNFDQNSIAKIGQLAEHNTVGVKCGIMDQFASLFGRKNMFIKLDCRDYSFDLIPFEGKGFKIVLADTQVKHSLASSEYNKRREECETGVKILAEKFTQVESLRDVDLKMIQKFADRMDEVVRKRCEYVIEENQRVEDTINAFDKGNIHEVGNLLYASHKGLSEKYEVSCAELDLLVEKSKNINGVFGARMMGGGFGGCTINLVKSESIDIFKNTISKDYSDRFKNYPEFYELEISDGAHEIHVLY